MPLIQTQILFTNTQPTNTFNLKPNWLHSSKAPFNSEPTPLPWISMPPQDRSITITHQGRNITWIPREYILPPLRLPPGDIEFPQPFSTQRISTGNPSPVLQPAEVEDTGPRTARIEFSAQIRLILPLVEDTKPQTKRRGLTITQRLKRALHVEKRPRGTKTVDTGVSGMPKHHMGSSLTSMMKALWKAPKRCPQLNHQETLSNNRREVDESSSRAEPSSYRAQCRGSHLDEDHQREYARSDVQRRCRKDLSPKKARRLSKLAPNLLIAPSTQRAQLIEERTQRMIESSNTTTPKMLPTECRPVFERDCINWKLIPGRLSNQRDGNVGVNVPNIASIKTCSEESLVNISIEDTLVISPHLVESTANEVMNDARSSCSEPHLNPMGELISDYMSEVALPSSVYPATHLHSRDELMDALHETLNSQLVVEEPTLECRVYGDREGHSQEHILPPATILRRLSTTDPEPDEENPILEFPSQAHTSDVIPKQGDCNPTSFLDTWNSYSSRLNTSSPTSSPPASFLIERAHDEMEDSTFIPESMMKGQILPLPPSAPLLSGSYSLLGSSYLDAPRELLRTSSPALTPYPSLESSATTFEFGFAPTLNHMPDAHHVETHTTPPESHAPKFENWRDVPMTCRSQSPSENPWQEPLRLRGGGKPDRFDFFTGRMLTGNVEEGKKILDAPVVMMDSYFVGCWGKGGTWRELCEKMEKRVEKGKELEKQRGERREAELKKKEGEKKEREKEKADMLKALVKWSKNFFGAKSEDKDEKECKESAGKEGNDGEAVGEPAAAAAV